MTDLILKYFVPGFRDTDDPRIRTRIGSLSGITGIVCNLLLFVGKLLCGILSGSVSMTADAMNNLSDASGAMVTLLGFKLAGRPADEDHPYGHARYEYLTGLAVAALILVIGFELGKGSVEKILNPAATRITIITGAVLLGYFGVKLWLAVFNRKLGRLINSSALEATAADSRNDVIATAAVLAAGVIEQITDWRIDGFIGLGVAVFILWSGLGLARQTISPLLGENADPELRKRITALVDACPEVLGYHDLMVHDYGPGKRFASLHVEMDKDEDPLHCHELIDEMERQCLKIHGVHLVIHYDPVVTNDPELDRMRELVGSILQVRDSRLSIHDFRMVPGWEHTNLIFDVAMPEDLRGQEKTIQKALEAALNGLGRGTYHTVITFDPESFNEL